MRSKVGDRGRRSLRRGGLRRRRHGRRARAGVPPLRRPLEQLLDCLCGRGGCNPGVNAVVATGAYTLLAVVVVVPDASPGRSCTCCGCAAAAATAAAAAAYSGGGTQMPPTTTNCGAAGGVTLVPLLWTATAVEFGRLVCRRYF